MNDKISIEKSPLYREQKEGFDYRWVVEFKVFYIGENGEEVSPYESCDCPTCTCEIPVYKTILETPTERDARIDALISKGWKWVEDDKGNVVKMGGTVALMERANENQS
jgi:hypothetical protein